MNIAPAPLPDWLGWRPNLPSPSSSFPPSYFFSNILLENYPHTMMFHVLIFFKGLFCQLYIEKSNNYYVESKYAIHIFIFITYSIILFKATPKKILFSYEH